jgi:DNA-binding MarR family transcriptional regulator
MYMTVTFDWALRLQRKTNPSQTAIISYLMENDNKFYGSYRELAKAMGKKPSDATNLCRYIRELEAMGIITSIVDDAENPFNRRTLIGLNDDWKDHI